MRKDLRERFAKECRYAVVKMQESPTPAKKLFYFSVIFGEAQRIFNWQWEQDVALIHMVTEQTYSRLNAANQNITTVAFLATEGEKVYAQLTQAASDLATYLEKTGDKDSKEELFNVLGRLSEIGYTVSGNGIYLYEKGMIKL